jgi:hypothetical protein
MIIIQIFTYTLHNFTAHYNQRVKIRASQTQLVLGSVFIRVSIALAESARVEFERVIFKLNSERVASELRAASFLPNPTARLVSSGLPSRFSRSGEKKFNQINFLIFYSAVVDSCNRVGGGLCFQKT